MSRLGALLLLNGLHMACTDGEVRTAVVAAAPPELQVGTPRRAVDPAPAAAHMPVVVLAADGELRTVEIQPSSTPPQFALVASRHGEIELSPRRGALTLMATLPYPVAADGTTRALQNAYSGLSATSPALRVHVAGSAGSFLAPGDGWLVLAYDQTIKHDVEVVPLSYRWTGDGWVSTRVRRGRLTLSHVDFVERGDTVFAYGRLDRLNPGSPFIPTSDRRPPAHDPPERLRGDEPFPELAVAARLRTPRVGASSGDLYAIGVIEGEPLLHLLHWPAGSSAHRSAPLPDVAREAANDPDTGLTLRVADRDILVVFGNLRVEGLARPIAYLAVGPSEGLRRVAIAAEGSACAGELRAAVPRPDGGHWLVLDDRLWDLDPRGRLLGVATPAPSWPEPREWYWDSSGWQRDGDQLLAELGDRPRTLVDMTAVQGHLWLRMNVSSRLLGESLEAIWTTGPHGDPVVLPGRRRVLGEIRRLNANDQVVQLTSDVDERDRSAFAAATLPRLTAIDAVWQVYEAQLGARRPLIAVVDPDAPRPALLQEIEQILGHPPELVSPPPPVVHMFK